MDGGYCGGGGPIAPCMALGAGGTSQIEGFPAGTNGTQYGGTNAGHDCGKVNYLRVEFAGFELAPNNELNAFTVGACGSATQIDHVNSLGFELARFV